MKFLHKSPVYSRKKSILTVLLTFSSGFWTLWYKYLTYNSSWSREVIRYTHVSMFPCSQQLHEYITVNIIVVYLFIKDQHNMVNGPLYQQMFFFPFHERLKVHEVCGCSLFTRWVWPYPVLILSEPFHLINKSHPPFFPGINFIRCFVSINAVALHGISGKNSVCVLIKLDSVGPMIEAFSKSSVSLSGNLKRFVILRYVCPSCFYCRWE